MTNTKTPEFVSLTIAQLDLTAEMYGKVLGALTEEQFAVVEASDRSPEGERQLGQEIWDALREVARRLVQE